MLDALVAEARLRWGLDPADGLQVVAAEGLVAAPIEPSRPLLIVPAGDARSGAEASRATPLPGRNGPGGDDRPRGPRPAVPGRPRRRAVGRGRNRDGRVPARGRLGGPLYLAPIAPELPSPGHGRCPGSAPAAPAGRLPVGPRADPHLAPEAPARGGLRGLRRARGRRDAGAGRGARRPVAPGRAPRAARGRGRHLRPGRRPGALATKIVRRHPHVFGDAVARTASDVNRQWERIKAAERADAGRPQRRRARSTASARRCRRWPPARRCRSGPPTSATTGRPSTASSTRSSRRPRSCARPRRRRERGPRSSATCCSCW